MKERQLAPLIPWDQLDLQPWKQNLSDRLDQLGR
jgi:hypothetical protein